MFKSDLPSIIVAGTTIEWVDEATTAGINETISSPDLDIRILSKN